MSKKYLLTYQLKLEHKKEYEKKIYDFLEKEKEKGISYKATLCKGIEKLIDDKRNSNDDIKTELKEIKELLISFLIGNNKNIDKNKDIEEIEYNNQDIKQEDVDNLIG